jgi:hypothetical protein
MFNRNPTATEEGWNDSFSGLSRGGRFVSLSEVNLDRFQPHRMLVDMMNEEDWRKNAGFLDRIRALLHKLPAVERDIIELRFFMSKKQEEIATILDMNQRTVSYRLTRAFQRLTFLLDHPNVEPIKLRTDLSALLDDPRQVDALCAFAQTAGGGATARALGLSLDQSGRLLSLGLAKLASSGSIDAHFYSVYFERLRQNPNILRDYRRHARHADAAVVRFRTRIARLHRRDLNERADAARREHEHGSGSGTSRRTGQAARNRRPAAHR